MVRWWQRIVSVTTVCLSTDETFLVVFQRYMSMVLNESGFEQHSRSIRSKVIVRNVLLMDHLFDRSIELIRFFHVRLQTKVAPILQIRIELCQVESTVFALFNRGCRQHFYNTSSTLLQP
uniref:Uncharacterized protein n=1 Tax=Daphnia galeata TaxID=27404 RepID=A0A8J2REE5_9CRUS|nr:unnamed protein product [Daphnia galeata]